MRKIVSSLLAFFAISLSLGAQAVSGGQPQTGLPSFNPNESRQEVRFSGAFKGYIGSYSNVPQGYVFSLEYKRFSAKGFGYGLGAEVVRDNISTGGGFGVPLRVAYRSPIVSSGYNVAYGAYNAANIALRNRNRLNQKDTWIDMLGSLILSMFSRAEVFAGLTPGFLMGDSVVLPYAPGMAMADQGIIKDGGFYLSADAGFSLCYRLYRFNLSLTPAIHYFIVDPYRYQEAALTTKPVRWQYTVGLGLGYLF